MNVSDTGEFIPPAYILKECRGDETTAIYKNFQRTFINYMSELHHQAAVNINDMARDIA